MHSSSLRKKVHYQPQQRATLFWCGRNYPITPFTTEMTRRGIWVTFTFNNDKMASFSGVSACYDLRGILLMA
jgi:hypothetical protein